MALVQQDPQTLVYKTALFHGKGIFFSRLWDPLVKSHLERPLEVVVTPDSWEEGIRAPQLMNIPYSTLFQVDADKTENDENS